MTRRGAAPRRRAATHARRPGPGLRARLRPALPSFGRIAAGLLTGLLIAGLVALVNGSWLRVVKVAWAGERYTTATDLQEVLAPLRGTPLLMVDAAGMADRLGRLPAVSEARVEPLVPNLVRVTIVEKPATFVWQTSAVRLLGAADGTLIGQVALQAELPSDLAALPLIDDRRAEGRDIIVGDRIDAALLAPALGLTAVDPAALGSQAGDLEVRLTDDDGFLLVSASPSWQADFGFFPPGDQARSGTLDERLKAQVAAVRTLFSIQPEAGIAWVDARDPERVYWRP